MFISPLHLIDCDVFFYTANVKVVKSLKEDG